MRPCYGTSPTGLKWLYVQPQHTGSLTIVDLIRNLFHVPTCGHGHFMANDRHHYWANVSFIFTFVANPFRRVLSNAAYGGVFNGSKRPINPTPQDIAAFNEWVDRHRLNATRVNSCMPSRRGRDACGVYSQAAMLTSYTTRLTNATWFVGCTDNLTHNVGEVLSELGYRYSNSGSAEERQQVRASAVSNSSVGQLRLKRLCHSESCDAAQGTQQDHGRTSTPWYEPNQEVKVRQAFEDDFAQFGFSSSAADMASIAGCRVRRGQGPLTSLASPEALPSEAHIAGRNV